MSYHGQKTQNFKILGSHSLIARNEDLVRDFKMSDCSNKFLIYGKQIQKNMEKGLYRSKFFDRSSILLCDSLPIFNPNHLVIRDVLDCTTTNDLYHLCN